MFTFLRSQKFKVGLPKVLLITFVWMVISVIEVGFDHLNFVQHGVFPKGYNVWIALQSNVMAVTTAGILAGFFLVFWLKEHTQSRSYGRGLWTIFGYYNLIFFFAITIGSTVYKCEMKELMSMDTHAFDGVLQYISELKFIRSYFFWGIVSILTMIALQINDKYGTGVFWSFLRGDYFNPQKEERIFMFLDLKGSTTIAEQIGEESYFNFLRDFFKDITPSILVNKGEIYQYVGDEVIISWKTDNPLNIERSLNCFFDIEQAIARKETEYLKKYGVIPLFKAGLHIGTAMIGEIGVIKKDIAFSGDVLNTTARIQAKCNEYGVKLLVSEEFLSGQSVVQEKYFLHKIGAVNLRGRSKTVTLFTVNQKQLAKEAGHQVAQRPQWQLALK
ncbi:MAG: adenylate/guanylate cyclase domain-containing protein [Bacteroidota bacterium]